MLQWAPFRAVSTMWLVVLGCSGAPPRISVPTMDPQSAGTQALTDYDSNKDGKIAGGELGSCPSLRSSLKHLDKNGDGAVDADEIAARITKYVASKIGIIPLVGAVSLDGKPLDGAVVTLTPEKFMGAAVEPAVGTSSGGMVVPSIEKSEVRGVRSGFYRITVSLKNSAGEETIPAQFNSASILGVEIAHGSPAVDIGWELKLSSRDGSGVTPGRTKQPGK